MMHVRTYEEKDEQPLKDFLITSLAAFGEYSWESWQHKYLRNPFGVSRPIVAEQGGEIVGHFGLILLPFDVARKSMTGLMPSDVAVSPNVRRQSLGKRGALRMMWEFAGQLGRERADFGFAIPMPGLYSVGRRFYRAEHLCTIPELAGTISLLPGLNARGVKGKLAAILSTSGSPLRRSRFRSSVASGEIFEVQADDMTDDFDELYVALISDRDVSLRKNGAYLEWRYLRHPAHDYELIGCRQGGKLTGFIVFHFYTEGNYRVADILDFECIRGSARTAGSLFNAFVDRASIAKTDYVRAWCVDKHPLRSFLEDSGLQVVGNGLRTLFIPVIRGAAHNDLLADGENWYFSMGDTDGR